jgi:hypothetical protein
VKPVVIALLLVAVFGVVLLLGLLELLRDLLGKEFFSDPAEGRDGESRAPGP